MLTEDQVKELLKPELEPLPNDFNPCEWSGGNYDDAYWMGFDRGNHSGFNDALKRVLEVK